MSVSDGAIIVELRARLVSMVIARVHTGGVLDSDAHHAGAWLIVENPAAVVLRRGVLGLQVG